QLGDACRRVEYARVPSEWEAFPNAGELPIPRGELAHGRRGRCSEIDEARECGRWSSMNRETVRVRANGECRRRVDRSIGDRGHKVGDPFTDEFEGIVRVVLAVGHSGPLSDFLRDIADSRMKDLELVAA